MSYPRTRAESKQMLLAQIDEGIRQLEAQFAESDVVRERQRQVQIRSASPEIRASMEDFSSQIDEVLMQFRVKLLASYKQRRARIEQDYS